MVVSELWLKYKQQNQDQLQKVLRKPVILPLIPKRLQLYEHEVVMAFSDSATTDQASLDLWILPGNQEWQTPETENFAVITSSGWIKE